MAFLTYYGTVSPDEFDDMDYAESNALASKVAKLVEREREDAWKRTEFIMKACGAQLR